METITKLLHCSKKNKGNVIMFRKWPEFTIEGYIDVDYVGSVDDRRPTSGYGIYLCDNLVIWRSKKQSVCARSSAEVEYRASLWLRTLLNEVGYHYCNPMKMYCDYKTAINLTSDPIMHDRTKHVELDRHFIRQRIDYRELCLPYMKLKILVV